MYVDEMERTVRAGVVSPYNAAILQCAEVGITLSLISTTCEVMGSVYPLNFLSGALISLVPLVTVVAAAYFSPRGEDGNITWKIGLDPDSMGGRVFHLIHQHTSNLVFVVNIVNSVALIAFGFTPIGICSFVALGYGVGCRMRIIPHWMRMQLGPMRKVIEIASLYLTGGWIAGTAAAYNSVSYGLDLYLGYKKTTMQKQLSHFLKNYYPVITKMGLHTAIGINYLVGWIAKLAKSANVVEKSAETTKMLKDLLNVPGGFLRLLEIPDSWANFLGLDKNGDATTLIDDHFDFLEKKKVETPITPDLISLLIDAKDPMELVELNYGHLADLPVVAPPEVDYKKMFLEFFDKYKDDEQFIKTLEAKLKDDDQWMQKRDKENVTIGAYVRGNLELMLTEVEGKKIRSGDLDTFTYQQLQNYLKFLADVLSKSDDKIAIQDTVIRLSIEAGKYCATGVVEVVEDEFMMKVAYLNQQEIVEENKEGGKKVNLKEKIYLALNLKRTEMVDSIYTCLTNKDFEVVDSQSDQMFYELGRQAHTDEWLKFFGKNDRHTRLAVLNMINAHEIMGLQNLMGSDTLHKPGALEEFKGYFDYFNIFIRLGMYGAFKEKYSKQVITDHIKELLTNSMLGVTQVTDHFNQIFDQMEGVKDSFDENNKLLGTCKNIMQSYVSSSLSSVKDSKGVIDFDKFSGNAFMVLMLVQMGVLKPKKNVLEQIEKKEHKMTTHDLAQKFNDSLTLVSALDEISNEAQELKENLLAMQDKSESLSQLSKQLWFKYSDSNKNLASNFYRNSNYELNDIVRNLEKVDNFKKKLMINPYTQPLDKNLKGLKIDGLDQYTKQFTNCDEHLLQALEFSGKDKLIEYLKEIIKERNLNSLLVKEMKLLIEILSDDKYDAEKELKKFISKFKSQPIDVQEFDEKLEKISKFNSGFNLIQNLEGSLQHAQKLTKYLNLFRKLTQCEKLSKEENGRAELTKKLKEVFELLRQMAASQQDLVQTEITFSEFLKKVEQPNYDLNTSEEFKSILGLRSGCNKKINELNLILNNISKCQEHLKALKIKSPENTNECENLIHKIVDKKIENTKGFTKLVQQFQDQFEVLKTQLTLPEKIDECQKGIEIMLEKKSVSEKGFKLIVEQLRGCLLLSRKVNQQLSDDDDF